MPTGKSLPELQAALCCGRRNREAFMNGYLGSLLMGLAVGVAYGVLQIRSPAPPLIALVDLLGMVLGEQAIDMAKRHFVPPTHASIREVTDDVQTPPRNPQRPQFAATNEGSDE
jgi:XapX domain-containing protein